MPPRTTKNLTSPLVGQFLFSGLAGPDVIPCEQINVELSNANGLSCPAGNLGKLGKAIRRSQSKPQLSRKLAQGSLN